MIIAIRFTDILWPILLLATIGGVFGFLIAIFSKFFYVKTDTRIEEVCDMLPGYNCGGCGKAGCKALAEDIVNSKIDPKICTPLKEEQAQIIREYLKKIIEKENIN